MKRLATLRHAKSSWDDGRLADFDRPLNDRGRNAAQRMGRDLKERGFDLVLASPAARVRQTLEAAELEAELRFDEDMYLASERTLLEIIRDLPDTVHAPLLVGHNPGLQELVIALARDDAKGLRRRVEAQLPTAAFVLIELPAEKWSDVQIGSGTVAELIIPKELD